jgi:hypothetical protein
MKTATFILLLAAALTFGMDAPSAVAQNHPDVGGGIVSPQLPAGTVARYRVTYFSSQTAVTALRSASVVSITNGNTASCLVGVDWRFGVGGALACASSATIGPGNTFDFCTRALPVGVTACNVTCSPNLTFTGAPS